MRALELLRTSVLRGPSAVPARPRSEINLQWLIHLRWSAILGQLITVLVVRFGLGVGLPLGALFGVIGVEFGTNAMLLGVLRVAVARRLGDQGLDGVGAHGPDRLRALVLGVTLLDLVLLTVLLALTGGTANPFSVFLVVHLALAAVLLPLRLTLVAVVAVLGGLVIIDLGYAPVTELAEDAALRGWGTVVALALTSLLTVYFVSRVTSALVDRSEQLESERERRERRRHLEALGTLAAGTAHELGTPLSTIAIVAKELERRLERTDASEDDKSDARLIRQEVARCRRILGRMSTDVGGGVGEVLVATTLEELGQEVIAEVPAASRVVLEAGDGGSGPPFELPREGLATTLRALVQNGLDASDPDGVVTLELRRPRAAIDIRVRDNGEGMTPGEAERALEPFYTTKDVGRGMGLGLYLASSYVESLGGTLEIDSRPGRGTEVRVRIPLGATDAGSWAPSITG